jgi:hypothetical protein
VRISRPKYQRIDLTDTEVPRTVRYTIAAECDRVPIPEFHGMVVDVTSYHHMGGGPRYAVYDWVGEQLGVKPTKTGHWGEIKKNGKVYRIKVTDGIDLD